MLPRGWAETTLGDTCEVNPKHAPDGNRDALVSFVPMPAIDETSGTIRGTEVRPLRNVWTGYTHFADGDVIFAKITPCMENGKAAIVSGMKNGVACGSTEFFVLRSSGAILSSLVWRLLRQASFRQAAERQMTGAVGQRRVPREYLERHLLALPPLAEQRRIVAKLDALTARIARARAELERCSRLRKLFKATTVEQIFADVAALTEVLRHSSTTIEQIIKAGPMNGWSPPSGVDATGPFTLKLTATTSGRLRLDAAAVKRIYDELPYDSKYWLKPGDLLIQRANALEHVGATAIYDGPSQTYIYPDLMIRIRVEGAEMTRLLWYYFNSPSVRAYFRDNATGTAGNMPKISGAVIRKLPFPTIQKSQCAWMLARLDAAFARADRLEAEAARAKKLLDRLEASILAKAFRGELVPQDPADEPASVLLDRIRTERAAAPKLKRGRRAAAASA